MSAGIQTDGDFAFAGLATPEAPTAEAAQAITAQTPNPLGALAALAGTWVGHGFNAIWRPHHPASAQDRFLESDHDAVFRDVALQIGDAFQNFFLFIFKDLTPHGFHFFADMS